MAILEKIIGRGGSATVVSDSFSPYGEVGGTPSRPEVQIERRDLSEAALNRKMGWDGSQLRTATDDYKFPVARKVPRAGGMLDLMSGIITSATIATAHTYELRWYEDVVDTWIDQRRQDIAKQQALIGSAR